MPDRPARLGARRDPSKPSGITPATIRDAPPPGRELGLDPGGVEGVRDVSPFPFGIRAKPTIRGGYVPSLSPGPGGPSRRGEGSCRAIRRIAKEHELQREIIGTGGLDKNRFRRHRLYPLLDIFAENETGTRRTPEEETPSRLPSRRPSSARSSSRRAGAGCHAHVRVSMPGDRRRRSALPTKCPPPTHLVGMSGIG